MVSLLALGPSRDAPWPVRGASRDGRWAGYALSLLRGSPTAYILLYILSCVVQESTLWLYAVCNHPE